jgi:hypothetical protein
VDYATAKRPAKRQVMVRDAVPILDTALDVMGKPAAYRVGVEE